MKDGALDHALEAAGGRGIGFTVHLECFEFAVEILANRFAQFVGSSPMQYLTGWRMQLAVRRLEAQGVSIAQAGAEVGYESEAAFNRAFKRFVGTPPGTWRKAQAATRANQAME